MPHPQVRRSCCPHISSGGAAVGSLLHEGEAALEVVAAAAGSFNAVILDVR